MLKYENLSFAYRYDNVSYAGQKLLWFEKEFETNFRIAWIRDNWSLVALNAGISYILLIVTLQKLFQNSKSLNLKGTLLVWNSTMALFSIAGTYRLLPELYATLRNNGVRAALCEADILRSNKLGLLWLLFFILSKIPEFGDTVFLILRKRKVSFLHWYHHLTVMVYAFYACYNLDPSALVFGTMNFLVHGIMYSYYTLTTVGVRPPKFMSMCLTSLQIVQMIVGCTVNYIGFTELSRGNRCDIKMGNIIWSSIMYFSYLVLFGHFFYVTYIGGKKQRGDVKKVD